MVTQKKRNLPRRCLPRVGGSMDVSVCDISVIIPIGPGHASVARHAVQSAIDQTIKCNIITINDSAGRGPAWARNRGVGRATTPLVVFLDADDMLVPTYAQETLQAIDWPNKPNSYIYTDWIDSTGVVRSPSERPYDGVFGGWHTITALIPIHWIRYIGGFDEALKHGGEDREFWYRLRFAGCCGTILHRPLLQYSNAENLRSRLWATHPDRLKLNQKIMQLYGGIDMCKSCGSSGSNRNKTTVAQHAHVTPGARNKTVLDFQKPQRFMVIIGNNTIEIDCSVLVRPRWRGNRTVVGRGTGYTYPRCASGDLLFIDPRDARAGSSDWAAVQPPAPTPAVPPPIGAGIVAEQKPRNVVSVVASHFHDVDIPKTISSVSVPPTKSSPDYERVTTLGQIALNREVNNSEGYQPTSISVDEIEIAIIQGGWSPLAGGDNPTGPQQNPREFAEFLHWCNNRGIKNVLELGTGRGGTARVMADLLNWKITTVDIKPQEFENENITFVQATTVDASVLLYGTKFDMVLIDASHEYYDVKRDHLLFQNHAPVVAFHDIAPGRVCCDGVARYWSELDVNNKQTSISADFPIGIGWYEQELLPGVDLSIVSGTYNRLEFLQNMVASARAIIPKGTTYEFVIIDGGSTDGTLEWLSTQTDIRVIKDGKLLGAIDSFTRGAYAARGRYVLLANDDITFKSGSIAAALGYIDSVPTCGAVAFADDRVSKKTGREPMHRVARLAGQDAQGNPLIYAQVGLFRKWLGNYVDWWGANTGMKDARTYAGDNYLSTKILELGYTVDAVSECQIDDLMAKDDLRTLNNQMEIVETPGGRRLPRDAAVYFAQYPHGPVIPPTCAVCLPPINNNSQNITLETKLRILYLPLYSGVQAKREIAYKNKCGLRDALSKIGMVAEVDYRNTNKEIVFDLSDYVRVWQPDLLIMQYHGDATITPEMLSRVREIRPDITIVNWNGDWQTEKHASPQVLGVLEQVDLHLSKQAAFENLYKAKNIPWHYWQQGYEHAIDVDITTAPKHDVVCLMNVNMPYRRSFAEVVENIADINLGLYGAGWSRPSGNTHLDYGAGEALYKNAKISLSDTAPNGRGYCSNRVIQTLAAGGALLLLQKSPGLSTYTGLRSGIHYIAWDTLAELPELIHRWLRPENEARRNKIARAGQEYILKNFTFDALIRNLWFEIMPKVWSV